MRTLSFYTVLAITVYYLLSVTMNSVKADEYNTAVLGHVVTQKIQGNDVQMQKLMEQELQRVGNLYAIQMIGIFQKYLPTILDGALTEMRLKADKEYKCALLKGTNIKDDCK